MFIYKVTNKINQKQYVGQTTRTISIRFLQHCKWSTSALGNAIKKYGKDNFYTELLSKCDSPECLDSCEDYWIDHFQTLAPNGYNLVTGGRRHRVWSETSLVKASKSKLGIKNPQYGKLSSQTQKNKASLANKGKPKSLEHRAKLSAANIGKKASVETRLKMSKAAKLAVNSGRFKSGKNNHGN